MGTHLLCNFLVRQLTEHHHQPLYSAPIYIGRLAFLFMQAHSWIPTSHETDTYMHLKVSQSRKY